MSSKRANLSDESLNSMGDAVMTQRHQLESVEEEKDAITEGLSVLKENNSDNVNLLEQAEALAAALEPSESLDVFEIMEENLPPFEPYVIPKAEEIRTYGSWENYQEAYRAYAEENCIDLTFDPFLTSLSQKQYAELKKEIDDDFSKRTSIFNKADLLFLSVAIALQTTKSLLFPLVAQKLGYGESFDKSTRLDHNAPSIKENERAAKDHFKNKRLQQGHEPSTWTEILYRKPIFDTTRGSPSIGFNMEGGYHRIHTLAHDPILGWFFGTANILTDTITLDTFATYQGVREPHIMITPERVPFPVLLYRAIEVAKADKLNLPAALAAEAIHLKSDLFTKAGLPIPILETLTPQIAGKLYKNQYDALCLSRDLKVIGTSAAISIMIDLIVGLIHGLLYNETVDGPRILYEARTRKILLISNTIATTSNVVLTAITQNPKNLDIGGLLVTLSHLFTDTRFIVNVKKEFIENKIYEQIEDALQMIDTNFNAVFDYERGLWREE